MVFCRTRARYGEWVSIKLEEGNEYLTRVKLFYSQPLRHHPTHRVLISSIGAPETEDFEEIVTTVFAKTLLESEMKIF